MQKFEHIDDSANIILMLWQHANDPGVLPAVCQPFSVKACKIRISADHRSPLTNCICEKLTINSRRHTNFFAANNINPTFAALNGNCFVDMSVDKEFDRHSNPTV